MGKIVGKKKVCSFSTVFLKAQSIILLLKTSCQFSSNINPLSRDEQGLQPYWARELHLVTDNTMITFICKSHGMPGSVLPPLNLERERQGRRKGEKRRKKEGGYDGP